VVEIRWHEAAETELYEALGFLELRAKGLGRRLLSEVRRTSARLAKFPLLGSEIRPRIRKLPLRTFRYSLVYRRKNSGRAHSRAHR
jgi:plasmid stabilization system protein ParE